MEPRLETRGANFDWPVQDIVYVSIVGTVMLAALLEWILWLLAFLYCLFQVYRKAEGEMKWSVRFLALLNSVIFIAMRCVFLPVMLVTLPLPGAITTNFPREMVSFLQYFAFWAFAGLLTIPWLFCVYQLVTHNVGRKRKVKTVLDEVTAPKVVIIMPCYNEEPEILLRTIDSIVDCDYPPSCMHVFLSFDGDAESELYLNTLEKLGVPLTLDTYPKSIDITYRSCRVTVSRFPHGGKRSCQKKTYKLIDKVYAEYLRRNDDLFLLFIDSDCILDKVCIQNFMYEMELKPGSERNMLAMTGVITSTTEKHSLITVLQDMEYIHGQLFERSVESGCGAVTCLPGALTMLRFSAFRNMAKYYFSEKAEACEDLFDYGKMHLGEDRWLTHLFMIGAKKRYQIQMNTGAFCKTEAVQTFKSLLKQRRRWFLGFITNEASMLTDIRLWKRYPLLVLMRLAQNTIRTTALLFFIMVISIITTSQKIANLPVGFIAVSLGLNWLLMIYFGAKLGRYKIMLYPLMFVVNPFFNWLYMVYGIFTAGQRTWGGPRADASKADAHTSPADAVEEAQEKGDDLNVDPQSFKTALGRSNALRHRPRHIPLMPPGHLEGRFAPAEELPGGWFQQTNDSGALHADMTPRFHHQNQNPYTANPRRESEDSLYSSLSTNTSIHTPRRVESIFDSQDAQLYHDRQTRQRPAGGAIYQAAEQMEQTVPRFSNGPYHRKTIYAESVHSVISDASSTDLHFAVPARPQTSSSKSHEPPPSRPACSPTRPLGPTGGARFSDNLAIPAPTYHPHGRSWSTGRSPLARRSFTRTAATEGDSGGGTLDGGAGGAAAEVAQTRRPRRRSSDDGLRVGRASGEEGRGRRPRKLSKARPESRDGGVRTSGDSSRRGWL
ncbi:hypothetical protein MBLNU230_g5142t1 [Neophaeotheca triangularis]